MRLRFWSLTFKCLILAITLSLVIGLITFGSSGVITWGGAGVDDLAHGVVEDFGLVLAAVYERGEGRHQSEQRPWARSSTPAPKSKTPPDPREPFSATSCSPKPSA